MGAQVNTPLESTVDLELRSTPTTQLVGLDYDIRNRSTWKRTPWDDLAANDALALVRASEAKVSVAAALSMHRDGYVREAMVGALGDAADPEAVRWIVLRCGDWVAEVRHSAVAALEPWLEPTHAAVLIDVLPLLDGDRFAAARPAGRTRATILAVIDHPESKAALEAGACSPEQHIRRACVSRLVADNPGDLALLRLVAATDDLLAISMVSRTISPDSEANHDAGQTLYACKIARLRAEGLWRLLRTRDQTAQQLALDSMADSAPSVREVAQRWLSKEGIDPSERYREVAETDITGALRGLGDNPAAQDGALARASVDSDVAPIRVAALRLLARLGDPRDAALFAERFVSGSGAERSHARGGLLRSGAAPRVVDELWARAAAAEDVELAKRVLFSVLPMVGRWKRVDIGLQAVASPRELTRAQGIEALTRTMATWNSGYYWATRAPAPELGARLDAARPYMTDPRFRTRRALFRELEFVIDR